MQWVRPVCVRCLTFFPMAKKASKSKQALPTDVVLSVRQPYAQLLVTARQSNSLIAEKWIENRSWEPTLPSGQPHWILIHASSTRGDPDDDALKGVDHDVLHYGAIIGYAKLIGWKQLPKCKTTTRDDKRFVKYCDLLRDIVEGHSGIRPDHGICHAENVPDIVHWIFVEPTLLNEPIPCAGELRLWTFPETLK